MLAQILMMALIFVSCETKVCSNTIAMDCRFESYLTQDFFPQKILYKREFKSLSFGSVGGCAINSDTMPS